MMPKDHLYPDFHQCFLNAGSQAPVQIFKIRSLTFGQEINIRKLTRGFFFNQDFKTTDLIHPLFPTGKIVFQNISGATLLIIESGIEDK